MLVAWIFQSIKPTIRLTITYYDTVKELLEDLKQRFSIENGPHIQQLRSDLAKCKQDGQSVAAYFGRMKDKQIEAERVHPFLMGHDDDVYGTIRSNIIAQEPLPLLNHTYALIIQEERIEL
ncbi:hypothetical protein Sango_2422100 [Sesamum angolense]|uniref:Retrotransposon gag domain-containing protein n=1 Tax=Sesamum angolense TaxID=2727404 RepID=A0AAE1W7F6_9LAMI|nr:hypothetical protein Sango_2422100 [Sesamum angolense]